jgi:uncharacterized membrane protein YgaE (UPF0421/DUF939 family)
MTWQRASIVPVWGVALVGAVLVGILCESESRLLFVTLLFAVVVLGSFAVQLAIRRKEGFVSRMMASTGGSLVILAAATLVYALLA